MPPTAAGACSCSRGLRVTCAARCGLPSCVPLGCCCSIPRAEAAGKQNIAFICHFLLGRLDACVDLLVGCGRLPEAAFFARTYAPSRMTEVLRGCARDARELGCSGSLDNPAVAPRSSRGSAAVHSPPSLPACSCHDKQIVKTWQGDLAKINPKAAESLANPEVGRCRQPAHSPVSRRMAWRWASNEAVAARFGPKRTPSTRLPHVCFPSLPPLACTPSR